MNGSLLSVRVYGSIRINSAKVEGFDGGAFSRRLILCTIFFIAGTEGKVAHIA